MSLNKDFDLYFTIRQAFLICLRDEDLGQKKNGLDSLFSEGSAKTRDMHNKPGRKNTALFCIPQRYLFLKIGGSSEKVFI